MPFQVVMELVHGIPLTEYCDQQDLTVRDRLQLFVQVCQTVQHAHQKGIIHRDIKPAHVLVTLRDGVPVPKIIDFGIAKAINQRLTEKTACTSVGQLIGTPMYMSPEQAEMGGRDVDTRSDIYSLGVLLYELLTGSTPFERERLREAGFEEVCRIIREEEPTRPSDRITTLRGEALTTITQHRGVAVRRLSQFLRGDLDWIVMKALEKDRTRRYESASAFAADVERYLADEPVHARPPTIGDRAAKWARRHRTIAWSAAASVLVIVTVLVVSTFLLLAAYEEEKEQRAAAANAAKAEENAARAAKNYETAREAVRQMLTRVADGELAKIPQMREIGKQLLEDAAAFYTELLKLNPGDGLAYEGRGRVHDLLAEFKEALADYETAVKLQPSHAGFHHSLGLFLLLCGDVRLRDGDRALVHLKRAIELSPQTPGYHGTLAAAYGGRKDFDRALVEWQNLVVGGYARASAGSDYTFAVLRYSPNGTLDPAFGGGDGVVTTSFSGGGAAHAAAAYPGGRIVLGGSSSSDFALARYNGDGALDGTFGSNGKVQTDLGNLSSDMILALAVDLDGRIVAGGQGGSEGKNLVRYTASGQLDGNFGSGGIVSTVLGHVRSVAIHQGPIFVAGGSMNNSIVLASYNADGSLNAGFGSGGIVTSAEAGLITGNYTRLATQDDGKILVLGKSTSFNCEAVLRLNTDGSLDNGGPNDSTPGDSFGQNGVAVIERGLTGDPGLYFWSIALQPDNGKIVVAGHIYSNSGCPCPSFALVRFNPDGSLDDGGSNDATPGDQFGPDGYVVMPVVDDGAQGRSVLIQSDGKIVVTGDGLVAGQRVIVLARYNPDGTLDANFGPPSPPPSLSINDVSKSEGNSGTTVFTFTVARSGDPLPAVSVNFATANGTATAGSDFRAVSGTLTIPAGTLSATITVQVVGDKSKEANETFYVNLANPVGAVIADNQGVGTIVNDDGKPRLMASFGEGAETEQLTLGQVQRVLPEALALWSRYTALALPNGIQVGVADLPAGELGEVDGDQILLDVSANDAGWFVDRALPGESVLGGLPSALSGRVDLLTVLAHEVGHALGFEHRGDPHDVMAANLTLGTRRLPGYSPLAVASVFILDPLGCSGPRVFDKLRKEASMLVARVEPLAVPLPASPVDQSQSSSRPADARLLHDAAVETTYLIDDELLDLLVPESV